MKHFIGCIFFLSVVSAAMAQADSIGKSNIVKDSIATKNIIPSKYMPASSFNSYLFFHGDSLRFYKSSTIFFPYRYVPGKYNNASIFNVTGTLLLGFIGYKTEHNYYYQPAH